MKRNDDRHQELELSEALTHVLDECRMVLPGIQALFGFQMIAVFNDAFSKKLDDAGQRIHLLAILLVVAAIGLLMAPAAIHRLAEPTEASDRFLRVAGRLLLMAMVSLALAIAADVYLVAGIVMHDRVIAASISAAIVLLFAVLWLVMPPLYRRTDRVTDS